MMTQKLFDIDYGREIGPRLPPAYVMTIIEGVVNIQSLADKRVCRKHYQRVVPQEKTILFTEEFFF